MHLIKQCKLNIECTAEDVGKYVHANVSNVLQKRLLPLLDELLDQYSEHELVWVIDKLAIELPVLNERDWENQLVDSCLVQIHKFLEQNYKARDLDFVHEKTTGQKHLQKETLAQQLFAGYLVNGLLNDNPYFKTVKELEAYLSHLPEGTAKKAFANALAEIFIYNEKALTRFILNTSEELATAVTYALGDFPGYELKSIISFFETQISYAGSVDDLKELLISELSVEYIYKLKQFYKNGFIIIKNNSLKALLEQNSFTGFDVDKVNAIIHNEDGTTVYQLPQLPATIPSLSPIELKLLSRFVQWAAYLMPKGSSAKAYNFFAQVCENYFELNANDFALVVRYSPTAIVSISNNWTIFVRGWAESLKATTDTTGSPNKTKPLGDQMSAAKAEERNFDSGTSSEDNIEDDKSKATDKVTVETDSDRASSSNRNTSLSVKTVSSVDQISTEKAGKLNFGLAKDSTKYSEDSLRKNLSTGKNPDIPSLLKEDQLHAVQTLYIENAGLVILHPFLSRLFENAGLYQSGEWKSVTAHQKAVVLTQYLVTGNQNISEADMYLNKLLCGFPVEDVLQADLRITTKEKKLCDELLEAVIQYWTAIKNTSAEALRETFLLRKAKLSVSGTGIELWVEQKAVDILLTHLPWGIGMVKTPWMKDFIQCNWY